MNQQLRINRELSDIYAFYEDRIQKLTVDKEKIKRGLLTSRLLILRLFVPSIVNMAKSKGILAAKEIDAKLIIGITNKFFSRYRAGSIKFVRTNSKCIKWYYKIYYI